MSSIKVFWVLIYFIVSNISLAQNTSFDLPEEIVQQLPLLMVDRKTDDPDSYMITEELVGVVLPQKSYRVTLEGLVVKQQSDNKAVSYAFYDSQVLPPFISVSGEWVQAEKAEGSNANILGGNGRLKIGNKTLAIPVAQTNSANLEYYGARMLKFGDEVIFETDRALPVFRMQIGINYAKNYLLKNNFGGGFYLEYHDMPHFHMPLNEESGGYLILGKKAENNSYHLSAFSIPFGAAIYTPGNVIHDDALLVGSYQVVYSVTENFSTVTVTGPEGSPVNVQAIE
jgi:hypothetical protein